MAAEGWLWALGAVILLVPVGLVGSYIWQAGLDLHAPRDAREYLELRRRGHEDVAGKALWIEARRFKGPLTVLMPGGTGDRDLSAELARYLAKRGRAVGDLTNDPNLRRRFFEAHAFALGDLQTGELRTLDGTPYRVECKKAQTSHTCQIGQTKAYSYFQQPRNDSSLYLPSGAQPKDLDFLPFLDGAR
ncbi:hypothetical protein [Deinococcus sp.]|uniref:hypothetical protein n=1 Tax=Deinococcus sp. TaxID=47478 RepID=UPI0025C2A935|nr:hypothetical protein [Deinococcus sp.]